MPEVQGHKRQILYVTSSMKESKCQHCHQYKMVFNSKAFYIKKTCALKVKATLFVSEIFNLTSFLFCPPNIFTWIKRFFVSEL
jgi:hypothetical protein